MTNRGRKPHLARLAKKKKNAPPPGTIDELRGVLWQAVQDAASILKSEGEKPELRLRAVHAITQSAGAYGKLVEATEFTARLKAVEEEIGLAGRST